MLQNLRYYSRLYIIFLALISFSSFNGLSQLTISIGSPVDGYEGGTDMSFDVSLDNGATNTTGSAITGTVAYTGTATNLSDYVAPTSFSIPVGASTTTLIVTIIDDLDIECDETVVATLSFPSVGTINNATSTATIIDDECPTSAFDPIDKLDLNIYPNPMSSNLKFKSEQQMKEYSIIDLNGRLVAEGEIDSKEFILNTEYISSGVYLIQVLLEDGQIINKNVLKN